MLYKEINHLRRAIEYNSLFLLELVSFHYSPKPQNKKKKPHNVAIIFYPSNRFLLHFWLTDAVSVLDTLGLGCSGLAESLD